MKSNLAFAALVGVIFVAGCALRPSDSELAQADYGGYPSDYREVVESYMSGILKDPGSAQYQYLNSPQRAWSGLGGSLYGYAVCVNINAKNSYGGYVGGRPNYFLIHNGAVVRTVQGDGQYGDAMAEGACKSFVGR